MSGVLRIPFVVHNVERPDNTADRRYSLRVAISKMEGGAGVLNEIHSADLAYLGAQAHHYGLSVYRYGTNAILWNRNIARLEFRRTKMLMRGGYVGADGVATPRKGDDDRRVGPNRYMLQVGLYFPEINYRLQIDGTHLMAKKDTSAKWRRPLWEKSVQVGGDLIADALDTHPNAIIAGDLNSREYRDWPTVPDLVIKTPSTHGASAHYDQIAAVGRLRVTNVKRFKTRSDHWGIVCTVHLSNEYSPLIKALEPKKVKKPTPVTNWIKQGSPVKHPWAKRSALWKRRHPVLWRKILRFQAAWRRKNRR
jgi:hypothetical protein